MKKLLTFLLSAIIALSLVGCNLNPDGPTPSYSPTNHTYNDFTPAEKALLTEYLGAVIPFLPNDHYTLEGYYTPTGYEEGFHFRTVGNTQAEFEAYKESLFGFIPVSSYTDDAGITWFCYVKSDLTMDLAYYTQDGNSVISVCVRTNNSVTPTDPKPDDSSHTYKDWSADDKALFNQYIGALIPFLPNDEYYIEGYYAETDYEYGLCFYTIGNTEAEFNAYLEKYAAYTFDGTYVDDEYGDTWHCYIKDDVVIDMTYYVYEGESCVEVYVYSDLSKDPEDDDPGTNPGGSTNENVITNDGKGLPSDSDGVYDVNFKNATPVKNVHDQGYYLDGCPTTGAPAVLVIPVSFSDGAKLTTSHIDKLELAFGENGDYYYSVDNYYRIASYGQMDLDVTVLDTWYTPKNKSTYYEKLTDSDGYANGDQVLLDEILQYLDKTWNLSKFDSDGNDVIDAVVLINNLDVGEDDFHWAYRYWNTYVDNQGYYYEYDGVSANDYIWASYYFLQEDDNGNYNNSNVFNTYTYIHEFGHVLGADDYYDTSDAGNHPMDGHDVMDYMLGDHNAYTKFNLGWITSSRLVVTNSSITLSLEDFSKNGDTIILANNWDAALGAYQEYYIVVYYTNSGLNGNGNGYFDRNGIVVYHVNASLYKEIYEGETYYDVYNNNTDISDTEYGTADNLLEFVTALDGDYIFDVGDTLPATYDDSGNTLGYTFTVISLGDTATVTFTKR